MNASTHLTMTSTAAGVAMSASVDRFASTENVFVDMTKKPVPMAMEERSARKSRMTRTTVVAVAWCARAAPVVNSGPARVDPIPAIAQTARSVKMETATASRGKHCAPSIYVYMTLISGA